MIISRIVTSLKYIILPVFAALVVFSSCRKDENFKLSDSNFIISQDTLLFDTVFTTIGSATKRVKIFNLEADPILVDVSLGQGESSPFRMNVDGYQGHNLRDIQISGGDSIYVFMEVTVDPDQPLTSSPFVLEDDLFISQTGVSKSMKLIAWGQNANYISQRGQIRGLACNSGTVTFSDDKPYVIYGILIIDSCELIIPAGTSVYIHGGVVVQPDFVYNDGQIIVFPNGKLTINGTVDDPVIFQGDRLEPEYEEIPAQWVGIRLWPTSKSNYINHALIKNSILGILVDSAASLKIENTEIRNTSGANIIGIHSQIEGNNLLLHSSGSYNLQLTYGGDYTFNYSTLVSQSSQREALYVNNYKCTDLQNDPLCQFAVDLYRSNIDITNSIIHGPTQDEINLDDYTRMEEPNQLNFLFENCIVRVDEILDTDAYPNFFDNCISCLNALPNDTLFRLSEENDYRLDTISIAEMRAMPITNISSDILGYPRDPSAPDIGCYEFEN